MKLSGPNFLLVLVVGAAVLLFGGVAYKTSVKPIPGQQPLEEIQGCDASFESLKTLVSSLKMNFVLGELFRSASGICMADFVCEEHFKFKHIRNDGEFARFETDSHQNWNIVFPTSDPALSVTPLNKSCRHCQNSSVNSYPLRSLHGTVVNVTPSPVVCELSLPHFPHPSIFHDFASQKYVVEFSGIPAKFKFIKWFSPTGNVANKFITAGVTDCQMSGSNIAKTNKDGIARFHFEEFTLAKRDICHIMEEVVQLCYDKDACKENNENSHIHGYFFDDWWYTFRVTGIQHKDSPGPASRKKK
eukprot:191314_1